MRKILTGALTPALGAKLEALGVPKETRRIVIDIKAGNVVVIMYETFAEEPLLGAILDACIEVRDRKPEEPTE